jgi:hypothetical protein
LELAEKLKTSSAEAELRSAVSRAYYGAFHTARLKIEACGVCLPESAEAHKKACFCLAVVSKPASAMLETLRRKRNEADYRLSDLNYQKTDIVATHVSTARACVQMIESLSVDAIRAPIRAYARDVLKYVLPE